MRFPSGGGWAVRAGAVGAALTLALAGCRAPAEVGAARLDDSWRRPTDEWPRFFYADDVEAPVRAALEETFAAGIAAWGNYGPIEYWVVGADPDAAVQLGRRFCERRARRGDTSFADCTDDGRQGAEFVEWATMASEMLHTDEPFLNAGWNGQPLWGVHVFASSYPPGWAGIGGVPIEDDQTVLLHEYFHAVQQAHILSLDFDERDRKAGPVWFVEGGAEFMAQATGERLRRAGALPRGSSPTSEGWSFEQRMRDKLASGLRAWAEHPDTRLADIGYGEQGPIAYDLGAWAVAYLCNEVGPNVLLDAFYPELDELGWDTAFERAFSRTPAAFYDEFDAFLRRPLDEQLAILPGAVEPGR